MHRDLKTGKLVFEKRSKALEMSPKERRETSILVIEPDGADRDQLRQTLYSIGYATSALVPDHVTGIETIKKRNFTHVIFAAQTTNMPPEAFLVQVLEMAPYTIAIPSSFDPQAEDVFTLLQRGARGFLVKPFTGETLENGILMATKGDPMSDAVLQAKDRNEAFSALIAASFDKLATAKRQSKDISSAEREVERHRRGLKNTMDIACLFAKGGEEQLIQQMIDFFVELGNGRATRLGRLRDRLKKKRSQTAGDDSATSADS